MCGKPCNRRKYDASGGPHGVGGSREGPIGFPSTYSPAVLHQKPCSKGAATLVAILLLVCGPLAGGCDKQEAESAPTPAEAEVRVASLVPAVTNMLLELGESEKLVAVSNYDTDPRVEGLPRAGDLLTIDWEQIAAARPTHMVVQTPAERTPPGAIERAEALGIEIVHVRITRLQDIFETLRQLELALTGRDEDRWWSNKLRGELDGAVPFEAPSVPVPTLIALSADLGFVAGRRNYLDDLLHNAGGVNVVPEDLPDYPRLDREMLLSLRPQKLVLILPDATEPQLAEARAAVDSLSADWGRGWEDVIVITDPYAMVPGWSVIEVSRRLTEGLQTR